MTILRACFARPAARVAGVIGLIMVIGLAGAQDYVFSSDEANHLEMMHRNYAMLFEGAELPSDSRYYGLVFNAMAEAAYQADTFVRAELLGRPVTLATGVDYTFSKYRAKVRVKHPFTFLFSLAAYGAVAGLVGLLCGWGYAWLGPLVLALLPRFWGHSFFNPKDVPFATGLTVASFAGALLLARLLADRRDATFRRHTLGWCIAFGVLIGLVVGIRIGGLILVGVLPIAFVLLLLTPAGTAAGVRAGWQRLRREALFFGAGYALIVAACVATVFLVHPVSWQGPFTWLAGTLEYMAEHPWGRDMLFEGRYGPPEVTPWYFIPKFVLITTPVVLLLAFAAGLFWLPAKYLRLPLAGRAAVWLVLAQLTSLLTVAIVKDSTVYNGLRQFLFILPALAVFAAAGLVWSWRVIPTAWLRAGFAAAIAALLSLTVWDMAGLHPYEYVYFNRAVGGVGGAQPFYETDYWHLSYREGVEWVNQHSAEPPRLVVAGNRASARTWARDGASSVQYRRTPVDMPLPFYYLAVQRHGYEQDFPECPTVHRVMRQGALLSVVKLCTAVAAPPTAAAGGAR